MWIKVWVHFHEVGNLRSYLIIHIHIIPLVPSPIQSHVRAVVPALHRKYVANMVGMFSECTIHGFGTLDRAHAEVRVWKGGMEPCQAPPVLGIT